jgi:hypothetical protein
MGEAEDAEIEGDVAQRAEEGRAEMAERDFCTGDMVSYCSAFSGTEMPCTVTHLGSVHQDRILLLGRQSEKSYKTLNENVRRSSQHALPHEVGINCSRTEYVSVM